MVDVPYQPSSDGFSETWGDDSVVFTPMAGNSRKRRIAYNNPDQMNFTWTLNKTQYLEMKTFYYDTLQSGSLTFTMNVFGTTRTCRFVSSIQTSDVFGDTYRINANVEVIR